MDWTKNIYKNVKTFQKRLIFESVSYNCLIKKYDNIERLTFLNKASQTGPTHTSGTPRARRVEMTSYPLKLPCFFPFFHLIILLRLKGPIHINDVQILPLSLYFIVQNVAQCSETNEK